MNSGIEVAYEVIPTGDIYLDKIEYKTSKCCRAGEINPILPWFRNTATSEECLACPVWLKAVSCNAPKKTTLQLLIYFNGDTVAENTFHSNGDECGGVLMYQSI
jgi:hypothetical protein